MICCKSSCQCLSRKRSDFGEWTAGSRGGKYLLTVYGSQACYFFSIHDDVTARQHSPLS
jgi:hypothetical protein